MQARMEATIQVSKQQDFNTKNTRRNLSSNTLSQTHKKNHSTRNMPKLFTHELSSLRTTNPITPTSHTIQTLNDKRNQRQNSFKGITTLEPVRFKGVASDV